MADTGFVFPGTGANRPIASQVDWSNPTNITADDGSNATVTLDSQSADGLAASNFDFSGIVNGSTIDGIEVRVGDYEAVGPAIGWFWAAVNLILADDSDGSEDKSSELSTPFTLLTDEAGGASDLWSETISDTDVKDVDWGFFVSANKNSGSDTLNIDFMQMKVYFTEPLNTGWKFPGTAVGNRTITFSTDDWSNPDNIKVDDTSDADADIATFEDISAGLAATNFDFSSIPVGATIMGIQVRVGDYKLNTGAAIWTTVRLILADDSDGSVDRDSDLPNPVSGVQTGEVGNPDDTWGEGDITRADVQDSDWGFFVGGFQISGSPIVTVDYMQMRVFYTTSSATAWEFPGTAVGNRGSGNNSWTTPDDIKIDDTNVAVGIVSDTDTKGLAATNFDFSSIVAGSTIDGIQVRVGDYSKNNSQIARWIGLKLILADDSDGSVTKHSDLLGFFITVRTDEAGFSNDLWGETITRTDVQDSDFGFSVNCDGQTSNGSVSALIDFMQMRVFYTPPSIDITDVDGDETWDDGDTGLVITGTGFV